MDDDKLDLGWGHPKMFETPNDTYIYNTIPIFEKAVKVVHKRFNNADTIDKIIIVGNGASQLLMAAIHALDSESVYAFPPHFSRFPEYTKLNNKKWENTPEGIRIITYPNNPDNNQSYVKTGGYNVFDLCYNWPTFIDKPVRFNEDIMIFSTSKATGHASLRVGWALVKDPVVAKKMIDYIEMTSGGVSKDQQEIAAGILGDLIPEDLTPIKKKLLDRWDRLREVKELLPFKALNESGQFLLAEGVPPVGVNVIHGEAMGLTNEFFRINLGCSDHEFNKFMELIKDGRK